MAPCRGRRQLGHDIPARTRCDRGVRLPPLTERCSARATRQLPWAMSQGGWGTGQSCHPVGLGSWLSSQPFQEQPGPAQPAPSPPHEALTLQMFRDSAFSRNSQRARNSGWRAAASCGICQHRREVSGGRRSPFYLLYHPQPAATSPRGLPQPPLLLPSPTSLSPQSCSSPQRLCPPPARGKQDPTSKQSAGNQLTASSPHSSPASRIRSSTRPQPGFLQQARGHHKLYNCLQTGWKVQSQLSLDPTQSAGCSPSSFTPLNLLA